MTTKNILSKQTVANICLRHLPMLSHGRGERAMQMMRDDFEKSIDRWFIFARLHEIGAKELIRILKKEA